MTTGAFNFQNSGILGKSGGDWFIRASLGNIPGVSIIHVFGRNAAVGTSMEDIWPIGGIRSWATTPAPYVAVSTNAADTDGGLGAHTVRIFGLDQNFNRRSETVRMRGTALSTPTTTTFMRITRACVTQNGIYSNTTSGPNFGTINVRASNTTTPVAQIALENGTAGLGESQLSQFTVPAEHVGILYAYFIHVDSSKDAQIFLWQRANADDVTAPFGSEPYGTKRFLVALDGVTGNQAFRLQSPIFIPPKTDVWWSAIAGGPGTGIGVDYEIILVSKHRLKI